MTELERLSAALGTAAAEGGVPVLATLTGVAGSAYRAAGARMVVAPDGTTSGAISGGCLERDIAAHAEQVRAAGKPRLVHYDLMADDNEPWGLGMGCAARLEVVLEPCPGGAPRWLAEAIRLHGARQAAVIAVDDSGSRLAGSEAGAERARSGHAPVVLDAVLFDYLAPPPALILCGDGPDVPPLAAMAGALGWVVRCVGRNDTPGELDELSAVVIMTHHYARDLAVLEAVLGSAVPYIGVLGPRRRTERLLAELRQREPDLGAAMPANLFSPAGLDIGAESPEEIALSILAEVRAVLAARPGGRLRDRSGPIHDRP